MWEIEIIKDWDRLWSDDFQKKWLRVMDESPNSHVFFHPALVKAWVETYSSLRRLEPIFVWGIQKKTGIEVLFPLVRWHQNWKNAFLKLIVPMGYSDFDYHDPVFSKEIDSDSFQSFYQSLLPLLPSADQIVLDGLHKEYLPHKFSISNEEICPCIDISSYSDFEEYSKSLRKSIRQNYQRRKNNLEKENAVQYIICDSIDKFQAVKDTISLMLKTHSERWPNAYKAPGLHDNLLQYGIQAGILNLYIIKVNDLVMSWRITYQYKNKLMLYMPTFSPEFINYSPGIQSLCFCIKDAIDRKLKEIDQLRGSETYKNDWSTNSTIVYNLSKTNNSLLTKVKMAGISFRKIIAR